MMLRSKGFLTHLIPDCYVLCTPAIFIIICICSYKRLFCFCKNCVSNSSLEVTRMRRAVIQATSYIQKEHCSEAFRKEPSGE